MILNVTYLNKLRSIVLSFTKLDPSSSELSKSRISDNMMSPEVELPLPIFKHFFKQVAAIWW